MTLIPDLMFPLGSSLFLEKVTESEAGKIPIYKLCFLKVGA